MPSSINSGIARSLSQIAERRDDLADAYFERREEVELPADGDVPGLRVWRESGLAVRLLRQGQTWFAARDGISAETFSSTVRRTARAVPRAPYPEPKISIPPWDDPPEAHELLELPSILGRALRGHHVSFVPRLNLRRHRRWVRVIGTRLASSMEHESFYSVLAEIPGSEDVQGGTLRYGALLPDLSEETVERLARALVRAHRARGAASPPPWTGPCILGPTASAVLLHEAVAHALEADTLALGGHPEAAIGVQLGSEELNVFDDPATAPESVRRHADDEGHPSIRRCLLRAGVVEQPICDAAWARQSEVLRAGGGRRGDRYHPPTPRSTHLELAPGNYDRADLMARANGGLYLPEVVRGHLDPLTGELTLRFPYGHRIENQVPGSPVGPCQLRTHVSDVLKAITAVGREAQAAGAGWCAKGGVKLPVWATAPDLCLEGIRIAAS